MASIIKRKSRYSVVYTYEDENGNKRQKWETFDTHAAAKKRKVQVEYEQENGSFVVPEAKTVSELLEEYVSVLRRKHMGNVNLRSEEIVDLQLYQPDDRRYAVEGYYTAHNG